MNFLFFPANPFPVWLRTQNKISEILKKYYIITIVIYIGKATFINSEI